ncbi:hypothetical protein [Plantactinospora veratri]
MRHTSGEVVGPLSVVVELGEGEGDGVGEVTRHGEGEITCTV